MGWTQRLPYRHVCSQRAGNQRHQMVLWAETDNCPGYSRIWHSVPRHPGAQRQALSPMHSPPFKHFCRQLAGRTEDRGLSARPDVSPSVRSAAYVCHMSVLAILMNSRTCLDQHNVHRSCKGAGTRLGGGTEETTFMSALQTG